MALRERTSRNRITKATVAVFAVIALMLALMAVLDIFTAPSASARVTEDQIRRLRNEKAEYERQRQEISEKIDAIEFERMAEMEKKELLDERITLTVKELENTELIIEQYSILITEKEYEIIIAQNREADQLQAYKDRVRAMEENGIGTYLEIIFDSTSFIDFLARLDFVSDIMRADEEAYYSLQQTQAVTVAAKEDLEETKTELDEESVKMELLKEELEEQLDEAHALILRIEANLEAERELYDLVTEESQRVQREINAAEAELRRQREAERLLLAAQQQAAGQQGGDSSGSAAQTTGSGELMKPTNGSVISHYGMRNGRMHYGTDFGAPTGTPVVAADGGTVITSSYGTGYGHYVVVSHGNGMTTLYAHLSSRSVSVGDSVSKGQQVGLVGSSGNATCPHLHFEVSVNGSRVNPMTKL